MAAEKTASVRLSLNGENYVAELKRVTAENEKATTKVRSGWQRAGAAGLDAMKKSAAGMVSSVRSTVTMVAGLGGSIALGSAVKGAMDLGKQFKRLSFEVQAGSGDLVDWKKLLEETQTQAIKWGVATEELGNALGHIRDRTGDLNFASDAVEAIAVTSRATGAEVGTLGNIAASMGEKFGIAGGETKSALAAVYSMAHQGGIPLEEMDGIIDQIGSSAKLAGIQGVEGFKGIMGLANIAKESTKNLRGALRGVMTLEEEMAQPEFAKKLQKELGVATKDANGTQKAMTRILAESFAKTGGKRDQLAKMFSGEQLKIVMDLAGTFREAFEGTSGTVKAKTAAGVDAFRSKLGEASKTFVDAAKMEERAKKATEGPAAQTAIAMERLKKVFASEEMLNGLSRLAKVAPEAAQKLAGLLEMVFKHPAMAAGIFAGMKLGAPLLQAAMATGAKELAAAIAKSVIAGGPAGTLGAGGGAVGAVGRAGAAAAAGFVGYQAGAAYAENVIDPVMKETEQRSRSLSEVTMTADMNSSGKFDVGAAQANLAELRKKISEAKKDKEFQFSDVYTLGMRRMSTASDKDIEKAEAQARKTEQAIKDKLAPSAEKASDSLDKMADSATKMADAAAKVVAAAGGAPGGGGASRGPLPGGRVTPGYVPR